MRKTFVATVAVVGLIGALAVVPGVSAGGKYGSLVAKDHDKGDSAVAVAIGSVKNPGKMTMVVKSHPRHQVAWNYTTDCVKDGKTFQWPPPGTSEDKLQKAPFHKTMKTGGVTDPDSCDVAASAKLDFNSAKSVTVKIYAK
jgi:hypothetical protein